MRILEGAIRMQDFGRVAVLYGGSSPEREISLKSGHAILGALQESGVNVIGIDVGDNFVSKLNSEQIDRVFIALHGAGGEDGSIQGLLEYAKIPYTGSGVLASALAMDKLKSKQIWQSMNLPTPSYQIVEKEQDCFIAAKDLGFPFMLKACRAGSSIGIVKIDKLAQIPAAWNTVSKFDDVIIAEQFIAGQEFTVSILENDVLPIIKINHQHNFLDFDAKYKDEATLYQIPCGLSKNHQQIINDLALSASKALDIKTWGRVDIMQDQHDNFWLLEINTVPGMTDHSLVPCAAKAYGLDFNKLVLRILMSTLADK